MIDFPIVDTHLHLWDPQKFRYPWLAGIPLLNKRYLLPDYRKACGPVKVEKMIFLQCEVDVAHYQQEAEWITELARQDLCIQGIVPWAPLEKGEQARPALESLAKNPFIKGIRRIIQFETDVEFCLRPDFVRGVQILADFDLHFEICIKGDEQFRNTIQLVRQCPQVNFILDHIGKLLIKEGLLDPWSNLLKEYASFPNTWCKMSGLVTEADLQNWTKEGLKPYIDTVMDCFGWDHVMFGGDWPVAFQATEYPQWVETLAWALGGASDAELRKVFHDNAVTFYRL